jgi:type IV pilus assembly protein PilE
MKNSPYSQGFSLVELMVIVAIIGILTTVAVPAYFNYINRTRQADAIHKLLDIKAAQEKYYGLYNRYAPSPITASTFSNLLNFDVTDAQFYQYSLAGTAADNFTAQANGNNTSLNNDCWQITDGWANPSTCGPGPDGFSFSIIVDLL